MSDTDVAILKKDAVEAVIDAVSISGEKSKPDEVRAKLEVALAPFIEAAAVMGADVAPEADPVDDDPVRILRKARNCWIVKPRYFKNPALAPVFQELERAMATVMREERRLAPMREKLSTDDAA